jgi:SAM-dependent methyltransferase
MTVFKGRVSPFTGLQHWYRSPLGRNVARIETACVQRLLNTTFGYYLVQIGPTEIFRDALAESRIRHRVLLHSEPSSGHDGLEILGLETQLPLASDSIDAILLPHTLDFTDDPRQILREVERVLIPDGRVIILGFNAMSAWGLWGLLLGARGRMPWCGRFRIRSQVEDWLATAGFAIESREHLLFCPPLRNAHGPRCAPIESLGRRFWPMLGGVYVIRAVKRVTTLTPLKPSWSSRRALLPGAAVRPTTTRGAGHA